MPTSAEFQRLYAALNTEQKWAVDAIDGPVMVLAGPGTGKTQTLAMRIANILQKTQMDPWNILCLTFTESGVAAMRERLISIIGTPAYYVRIHTFHSFCNEIITEYPQWFAKAEMWQLISDAERVHVFRTIVDSLSVSSPLKPFHAPYMFFSDTMQAIRDIKQENISPDAFEKIVTSLEKFLERAAQAFQVFIALRAQERTDASCKSIQKDIARAARDTQMPKSILQALQHLFDRYEHALQIADGVREQGKARTILKNSLKKWFDKHREALPKQQEMIRMYRLYEEMLVALGRYDYEDMITMVTGEMRKNDALLAKYQEQFQFILVDEYQDTNGAQNEIVGLLGSFDDSPNIFVVGDDKQSIYRFQGASLSNMLSFYEQYKRTVRVLSLQHNYRSQKTILDAAHAVISNNNESLAEHIPDISQELTASAGMKPSQIIVHTSTSEDMEMYAIAQHASRLIASGAQPEDITVLYRTNADGEDLIRVFRRLGIPARIEMGENIFTSHAVRQYITLFEWLVDGNHDHHIARIIQYSWWDIDAVDALKAIHYAGRTYLPLFTVIANAEHLAKAEVEHVSALMGLAECLAVWRAQSVRQGIMEFLEEIVAASHVLPDALVRENGIEELRAVHALLLEAKKLSQGQRDFTLSDFVRHLTFLEYHRMSICTPEWEGGRGAVRLMTAHKAKGLEFPHVVIMRMNDRHWGGGRTWSHVPLPDGLVRFDVVLSHENNEDERRLFYVALTRAMKTVMLTRASHSAIGKETVPSIFLSEIPEALVQSVSLLETLDDTTERLTAMLASPIPQRNRDDGRAYVQSMLQHYAMSVTHLNTYLACPRKFFMRDLLRIPSLKTRGLAMGTAVHAALYDAFEKVHRTGERVSAAYVADAYEKYLGREALSDVDYKDVLQRGKTALMGYWESRPALPIRDVLLEHNFRPYNVRVAGVPITGTLDKIEIISRQDKTVNVVDYKTGRADNWRDKLRRGGDYVRQMVFYQLLCDNASGFGYTMVSGEFDFIESYKGEYIKKQVAVSNKDTKELTETIVRVWEEIQQLQFLDPEKGCGKRDCEYCV